MKRVIISMFLVMAGSISAYADDMSKEDLVKENEKLRREIEVLKKQLQPNQEVLKQTPQSSTVENKVPFQRVYEDDNILPKKKQQEVAVNDDIVLPKKKQQEKSVKYEVVQETSEEESDYSDMDEIVVTATRTKQSIKDVGSSITVVTSKQIEDSKAPLILDVIRNVPGLEVSRTQGLGGTTNIFMRGGNSDHTLVFIDGVQVNSTTSGSFNFANLTTDNIERIEVLRGPQSTLYGSDAIGGVINIFTKKGTGETKIALSSEYGTHETYREKLSFSGGKDGIDFSSGLSYLKTHGISDASSGREEDNYENYTGSARVGYDFLESGRVDTTLRVSHSDFELDGFTSGIGPTDDEDRRQKTDEVFFSTKVENTFFDIWTPSILISVNDTELEGFDLTNSSNEFRIPTRLWRAEHQSDVSVTDNDVVTLGFEYEVQEGEGEGSFDKMTTYNRGAFIQNQIKLFDRVNWTAGLRYDRHSSFGVHYTYRSTLSYNFDEIGTRLHGSWGKGFKAPTINDLFFPNFGNSSLDPEESKGWDMGIEKEFLEGKLVMDVTYFENDFTDLIVATSQPDGSFKAENVAKAEAEGFETMLTYKPFNALSVIGSYTYTDTTDRKKNDQLSRRPRNRASLTLNTQPLKKLNLNLSGIMVRDRINSNGSEMEDYWIANLAAQYQITKIMKGYLRFENLFDRDYEEVDGFDSLDLTMYGGIDFKF